MPWCKASPPSPASKKKHLETLWINRLDPKLTRPDSRSPSSITLVHCGRSLSPFPQPGRRDRSVRWWVLCESPKGHNGPSRLRNLQRWYPSILLPQSSLHRRKLPHVACRGRENAQTRLLLCHARSSWFVFPPSFFSLFLMLPTQTNTPFFPQNSQFRAVVSTT